MFKHLFKLVCTIILYNLLTVKYFRWNLARKLTIMTDSTTTMSLKVISHLLMLATTFTSWLIKYVSLYVAKNSALCQLHLSHVSLLACCQLEYIYVNSI